MLTLRSFSCFRLSASETFRLKFWHVPSGIVQSRVAARDRCFVRSQWRKWRSDMEDDLESSATADDQPTDDQAESDPAETVDVAADVNASDEGVAPTTDESDDEDTGSSVLPLCPYCGSSVDSDPIECPACSTTYHFDCASEAGGCIQPGCSSSVLAPTEPPPPPPASSPTVGAAAQPGTPAAQRSASPKTRNIPRVLIPIGALLIGLLLGGLAIKTNVASALVGKSYSKSEVTKAKEDGYASGYSSGREAGYSSGRTSGLSEGKSAGCRAVFSTLGTTRVMDYYDWLFDYIIPSTLSSSAC